MEIILSNHAVDEFKRHLKVKGDSEWSLGNISSFFLKNPVLVEAISYSLPRGGKKPFLKGSTNYLARMSWLYSACFLLLVKKVDSFVAVTSLSGREFRKSVRRKLLRDISENEIHEKITFKFKDLYAYYKNGFIEIHS